MCAVKRRDVPADLEVSMLLEAITHRFSVEEFHRMGETGILDPDARVELIDGVIVDMTPISTFHQACVDRLTEILVQRGGGRVHVRVQGPVILADDQEPQPDLVLLQRRPGGYVDAHPRPHDVLLVIEVSHSSAPRDRRIKLPRYARFGVPVTWIADLEADEVVIAERPSPDGYLRVQTLHRGAVLGLETVPGLELTAEEILGPRL
jgi:Uma2 family endonuclease